MEDSVQKLLKAASLLREFTKEASGREFASVGLSQLERAGVIDANKVEENLDLLSGYSEDEMKAAFSLLSRNAGIEKTASHSFGEAETGEGEEDNREGSEEAFSDFDRQLMNL